MNDTGRHHIGLFIGDDTVIEAKGTKWGVVTSKPDHWDEWGELTAVDYSDYPEEVIPMIHPTLRKGDRGDEVKDLQTLLNKCGYILDVDGAFGSKTEEAVKDFQRQNGLTVDGIVGPKTWEALDSTDSDSAADEDIEDDQGGMILVDRDSLVNMINQIEAMRDQLDGLAYTARGWIE